ETIVDYETGEIHYQQLDGLINNYNETIIEALRCNMDIKFIGSGTSAKAILYYITDYISKSQLRMHVVYNALEIAINKLQNPLRGIAPAGGSQEEQNRAYSILRKAANSIIALQELSAQQVALFALRGADFYTSHCFRRLYWRHIEEYVDRILPLSSNLSSDTDGAELSGEQMNPDSAGDTARVGVNRTEGFVRKGSQLSDYLYRPRELESLSLWDFTAHCEKVLLSSSRKGTVSATVPVNDTNDLIPFEAIVNACQKRHNLLFMADHLESSSHCVRVFDYPNRSVPVLVGGAIPRRNQINSDERFCRLMLIFFRPWRKPEDLLNGCHSWTNSYNNSVQGHSFAQEHLNVINNIQLLHECKDSRDADFRRRRAAVVVLGKS
ncbi:hypothetical protein F5887DRAFT_823370, partial [Amanita rubescens]